MLNYQIGKDYRFWALLLALASMLFSFIYPAKIEPRATYELIAIVDITRSMNAEDYKLDEKAVSRLEYIKHTLSELLLQLPCESRLGLGVFTDRRSTLLFDPIDVCTGHNELDAAIKALDWRMAWAADSRIASGLFSTLEMLKDRKETILFMTDGHEAPPVNPRYRTDFSSVKNKLKGLVVGIGGTQPVPIPKYNQRGEREGFYSAENVPHRSAFGESDLNPEKIEGYNARNAPFGSAEAIATEHLSALNESYLSQLSLEAGFEYLRLTEPQTMLAKLEANNKYLVEKNIKADLRWRWTILVVALVLLLWV
jgi:mxaL protein